MGSKVKVGDYKGFEIFFCNADEVFSIIGYDYQKDILKSYSSCKNYINKFIVENNLFGSFHITIMPNKRYIGDTYDAEVVGMHANGNFLCVKSDGTKFQLADYVYDTDKWCLTEDLAKSLYDESKVSGWEQEIEIIRGKIKEHEKLLPKTCTEFLVKIKKEKENLWK